MLSNVRKLDEFKSFPNEIFGRQALEKADIHCKNGRCHWRRNMKEILSACSRRVVWQLGAATAVITAGMYAAGKLFLVPAFFIGYLLAAASWWALIYRIWKSSRQKSIARAKRQMQFGLGLRLLMIFVVLSTAIRISLGVFWSAVGGFTVLSVLLMANIIAFAGNGNADEE